MYAIESSMVQLNQTIVHPYRIDAMSNLLQLQRSNTTTQQAQCTLYHAWFTPITTWWKCIRDSAVQSRKRPAGGSLSQNGRVFDSGSFFRRASSNPRMMNHGSLHPIRCGLNPKCQFLNSSYFGFNPTTHGHGTVTCTWVPFLFKFYWIEFHSIGDGRLTAWLRSTITSMGLM